MGGTALLLGMKANVVPLTGTDVKVKEDFGFAGQVGLNFKPADAKNWSVFADVRYAKISPEVTVKAGGISY